ncbi:MAG: hypothetical protein BWY72_00966 [Bacteroidetes bacterium ADurb.Bin416]|nr:MAG: hypothetical protein BWY72_00966 [Bacteroidetes bacterium ADurb.Bin416]
MEHLSQAFGLIADPVFLRSQPNTGTVGPTPEVGLTEGAGAVPGGGDEFRPGQAAVEQGRFEAFDFIVVEGIINGGYRVLPNQVFLGDIGSEVATLGAKVAVG